MSVLREQIDRSFNPKATGITEFAEEMCNKPLYPRQRVLLKLVFLEEMNGYEEDVLSEWIAGGEVLISPKIRERRTWLRENGYPHFRENILVGGRRSSKGYVTGIAGAKKLYDTQQMGDPGLHYGIDPQKEIYFTCVAASLEQAKQFQFADLAATVGQCKPLAPHLSKLQEEGFSVHTAADERYVAELKSKRIKVNRDFAKLRAKPLAANADTIRGSTSMFICFDEMAFMLPGESRSTAEQCFNAAAPALAQFGRSGLIFCNSSPYTKIGKFYERFELAMSLNDVGAPLHPLMFAFQFPSWELYRDYDKDPDRRFKNALMVSPDWPTEPLSLDDQARQMEARFEEEANPETFKVERRAQWAEVVDAYLRPEMIDRAFDLEPFDGMQVRPTNGGIFQFLYKGHCFSGDTRIMTDAGTVPLEDLAGNTVRVLSSGEWRDATVEHFGNQRLYDVTLSRNTVTKVVRATSEHIWLLADGSPLETRDLKYGDKLATTTVRKRVRKLSPFGIARGFVFGDGSEDRAYCHGEKDAPMAKYYEGCSIILDPDNDRVKYEGTPLYFKDLPPITETPAYLYGWLAGYFAADGSVAENGRTTISSAKREHLEFVRDVCARIGIFTWGITSHTRLGYGKVPTPLYRVQLSRDDLNGDFFLLPEHRKRFEANPPCGGGWRRSWKVESVGNYSQEEPVYCAIVPGKGTFALEDHIHVHNCDPSSTTAGFGFAMAHVEEWNDPNYGGEKVKHVVFDLVKRWNPKDYAGQTIDYISVQEEIADYIQVYRPQEFSFDQFQSQGPIQWLRQEMMRRRVTCMIKEKTATKDVNWKRWETFKTALNLGLVHVPPDCPDAEYASQELKFLQVKNGKVDRQEIGPVTTKDIADCIAECTEWLIGNVIESWKGSLTQGLQLGAQGGFQIGGRDRLGPASFSDHYGNRHQVGQSPSRGINPMRRGGRS